jgi:uncharacterized delta-60 repeat protein
MSSVYCSTCDGTQESWVDIGNLPFNYPSLIPNDSFVIGDGFNDTVISTVIQSDNKILVGGYFNEYSGVSSNYIIRLNTDGSVDTSFIIGDGFNDVVRTIELQPDGKIIVGGGFTEYSGVSYGRIIRLNTDGSIDESFTFDSGFDSDVYSLLIQPDGKIVVGGDFGQFSGLTYNKVIRLNDDGSIDESFIIGDGFNGTVFITQLQPDGKIIVGGGFTEYSGVSYNNIIRLNNEGSIDESFIVGDGFDSTVNTLQLQPDGKILVGGWFNTFSGVNYNLIIRLNDDGSIDESFVIGSGFDDGVYSLKILSDGKIAVGGYFGEYNGTTSRGIVLLNNDGSLFNLYVGSGFNSTPLSISETNNGNILLGGEFNQFNGTNSNCIIMLDINLSLSSYRTTNQLCVYPINGFVYNGNLVFDTFNDQILDSTVLTLEIQPDGKVLVGGDFTNRIIRLFTDGSIDPTFNVGSGFNGTVYKIKILDNGKILVGGNFNSYNGYSSNYIARLNSDGSFDETFDIGTGFNNVLRDIEVLPDGRILCGGVFTTFDVLFSIGNGFNNWVQTISLQSDGKILVGGNFNSYSGVSSSNIIRLNTDGSVDNSFVIGTGFNNTVFTIEIQSDGKILVGGGFTSYSGVSYNRIIRLNTDGSVDTSFVIGSGFNDFPRIIQLQSDGKILVGGWFNSYSGYSSNYIARLNSDGSFDETFDIGSGFNNILRDIEVLPDGRILCGGQFTTFDLLFSIGNGFNGSIYSTQVQPDGKIIVGGFFSSYSGISINRIIRLNTDGSVDNSFVVGTGFDSLVNIITLQPDGKILVGGFFSSYSGISYSRIIRLNTNGSVDNSFAIGTGFNNNVRTIQLQSDGKIIVGGDFTSYSGSSGNRIIRLNTDGSIDTSFVIGSGFNNILFTIELQSDGKLLVGGSFTSYSGVSSNYIIRLNTNGSVDTSFVIGGGFNNTVNIVQLQSDGKILVGGAFGSYSGVSRNYIIRLNTNGSVDNSFVIGTGFNTFVRSIQTQSDGKIIVGGDFTFYGVVPSNYIIRLNTNGSVDTSFVIGTGFNGTVLSIELQPDGKILAGGSFGSYNIYSAPRLIRLRTNGSIDADQCNGIALLTENGNFDTSFVIGTGFNGAVWSMSQQTDGKILVGGFFTSYSGVSRSSIVRLNADGSVDTSFVIGTGFNGTVISIQIQLDGKILVGGDFTSYSGVSYNKFIRLNTDGSIDTSFIIGTGFSDYAGTIKLQPDGKILVGGGFTSYSGYYSPRLIRLKTNGSIDADQCNGIALLTENGNFDTSFVIGTGFNLFSTVYTIQLQSDGKILVGGSFTSYSGVSYNRIIRLNTDGSVDTSFVIGSGFNSSVSTVQLQSDGKILVGGGFTSYSGYSSNYIARLNSDGSIDTSFVIGSGFGNYVSTIELQSDGKLLVGGDFTSYSGVYRNNIIRLNTDGSIDNSFVIGDGFNGSPATIQLQPDGKILVGGYFTTFDFIPRYYIAELYSEGSTPFELSSFLEFSSCTECFNFTINSGDEYLMCEVCSGDTFTVNPPHPVWTNNYGTAVTQLDAIVLGGPNGLNN